MHTHTHTLHTSPQTNWFWNFVSDLTTRDKRRLLAFVSGSDRVPVGGLGQMRLVLVRTEDITKLPVARTCFAALELPAYLTEAVMYERLSFALEHSEGFGLA
jgi:hypothetical protein